MSKRINYEEILRRELFEDLLYHQSLGKSDSEIVRHYNEKIETKIHEFGSKCKNASDKDREELIRQLRPGAVRNAVLSAMNSKITPTLKKGTIGPKYSKLRDVVNFIGGVRTKEGRIDSAAIALNYDCFNEFVKRKDDEVKRGLKKTYQHPSTESLSILNVSKDSSEKAQRLKEFLKDDCYLYVFDQDIADDNFVVEGQSIDALVLKVRDSENMTFDINNIKVGMKANYEEGILEWGDREKRTFDLNFKKHRRNLHMRFYFNNIPSTKMEIILGKYMFTLGAEAKIVTGSVVLEKCPEGQNCSAYNYRIASKEKQKKAPLPVVVSYLVQKSHNFQKVASDIFTETDLETWLDGKLKKE